MKYSSAQINKMLKTVQEQLSAKEKEEDKASTYDMQPGGNPDEVRNAYDYAKMQSECNELRAQVRKMKHLLNVFNTSFVVEVDDAKLTIDEILVWLPQETKHLARLKTMKDRLPKEKISVGYLAANKGCTEYRYVNYNIQDVEKDYNELSAKIARVQVALDRANSLEVIEM